jgi:hypothetical protein
LLRNLPAYDEVLIVYNSDDPYGDQRGKNLAEWYATVRGNHPIIGVSLGSNNTLSNYTILTTAFDAVAAAVTANTKYIFFTGIDCPHQYRGFGYIQGFAHLDIMAGYIAYRNGSGNVSAPYNGDARIQSVTATTRTTQTQKSFIGGNYWENEISPSGPDPFQALSGSDFLISGTEKKYITGFIGGAKGVSLATSQARILSCIATEQRGGLRPEDGVVYATYTDRDGSHAITNPIASAVKGFTIERAAQILEGLGYTVRRYVRDWDAAYTIPEPASDFDLGIVDNGGSGGPPTMPSGPLDNVLCMIGTGIANNAYSTFPKPFEWLPGSFWIEPTSSIAGRAVEGMNAGLCCAQGAWMEPYTAGVPDVGRCIELLLRGYRWCEVFSQCVANTGKTNWYGDPLYQPFNIQAKSILVSEESN